MTSELDLWSVAEDVAQTPRAPAEWRETLARALLTASQASFVGVFTCPPSRPLEAQPCVVPDDFRDLIQLVIDRFLSRIERTPMDSSLALVSGPRVYAPLEQAHDTRLAERLRTEVYAPRGINGLLSCPFITQTGSMVGWVVVGGGTPSAEMLAQFGARLATVVELAVRTLETAMALATACGATVPSAPEVRKLSAREREVAKLAARGLSDAGIADQLGISEQTVGTHLRRIFSKLGIHSRVELVATFGGVGPAPRDTN